MAFANMMNVYASQFLNTRVLVSDVLQAGKLEDFTAILSCRGTPCFIRKEEDGKEQLDDTIVGYIGSIGYNRV